MGYQYTYTKCAVCNSIIEEEMQTACKARCTVEWAWAGEGDTFPLDHLNAVANDDSVVKTSIQKPPCGHIFVITWREEDLPC